MRTSCLEMMPNMGDTSAPDAIRGDKVAVRTLRSALVELKANKRSG